MEASSSVGKEILGGVGSELADIFACRFVGLACVMLFDENQSGGWGFIYMSVTPW